MNHVQPLDVIIENKFHFSGEHINVSGILKNIEWELQADHYIIYLTLQGEKHSCVGIAKILDKTQQEYLENKIGKRVLLGVEIVPEQEGLAITHLYR